MSSSEALSKAEIYAPLNSYTNAGSSTGSKLRHLKSLKEERVCEFIETVSREYTGSGEKLKGDGALAGGATVNENNIVVSGSEGLLISNTGRTTSAISAGSKALRRNYIDDKILQRSLTLVGGGIVTGGVGKTGTACGKRKKASRKRVVGSVSNTERKKRGYYLYVLPRCSTDSSFESKHVIDTNIHNEAVANVSGTVSNSAATYTADAETRCGNTDEYQSALHHLSKLWGSYAERLTEKFSCVSRGGGGDTIVRTAATGGKNGNDNMVYDWPVESMSHMLSMHLELCGAPIRVVTCASHPKFIGLDGMIAQETANTWRIVTSDTIVQSTKRGRRRRRQKQKQRQRKTRMQVRTKYVGTAGVDENSRLQSTDKSNFNEKEEDEAKLTRKSELFCDEVERKKEIDTERSTKSPPTAENLNSSGNVKLVVVPKDKSSLGIKLNDDIIILVDGTLRKGKPIT